MNKKIVKAQEGFNVTSYREEEYLTSISGSALAIDSSGNIYSLNSIIGGDSFPKYRITKTSPAGIRITAAYTLNSVFLLYASSMCFDNSQNLYYSTPTYIFKIINNGASSSIYGGQTSGSTTGYVNGAMSASKFDGIVGMVFDASGNLYISDRNNHCIRRIAPNGGQVTTYAGALPAQITALGISGYVDNTDTLLTSARFKLPGGITIDSSRNLYVVDNGNGVIRKISTSGNVTTISSGYIYPYGITIDSSGNLYVSDVANGTRNPTIYKLAYNNGSFDNKTTLYTFQYNWAETVRPYNIIRDTLGNIYAGCQINLIFKMYKISQSCSPGSYLNNGDCVPCELSSYSAAGATACTPCPINRTTITTGSSNVSQCVALKGFFGTTANSTTATAGTACPSNTTTPSTGATSSNDCSLVNAGYYMNGTTVTQCPANTSCPGGPRTTTTAFTCANGYKTNAAGTACEQCAIGFYGIGGTCSNACPTNTTTSSTGNSNVSQCTIASAGYFMSGGILQSCPSNTTSLRESTSASQCTASNGYYMSGGSAIPCPSNASCPGGTASFSCFAGYKKNGAGNGCEECGLGTWSASNATTCTPCPSNTTTSLTARTSSNQCTSAVRGYYMSNGTAISCPSNSSCEGGSASFLCSNGYETRGSACVSCGAGFYGTGGSCLSCSTIPATDSTESWTTRLTGQTSCVPDRCKPNFKLNALSNNCDPCPEGTSGSNCTSASIGFYMSGGSALRCPPNSRCDGGATPFVCSNGYFVNYRTGTCDIVTTIVQPGNSQLFNTRGSPTIADTTACLATGCTLLFKDPVTGDMLPRNPCISQGDYYDFATKNCINKCCLISMSNAKNDTKCKTDVTTTPAVRKPGACPPRSAHLCCKGNYVATNTSCRNFWNPGVDAWTAERNTRCAAGFSDYDIDSISEKRRKYLALA